MQKPLPTFPMLIAGTLLSLVAFRCAGAPGLPSVFTRLGQLPPPKIVASSEAYPGGGYNVSNIIDGKPQTEYSSNANGTDTYIEFDFGAPVSVAAFRHVDRNDPATIASSQLSFVDESGAAVGTVPVKHVNQRGGVTFLTLPSPVTARRVRWQVTGLGAGLSTVGGAEIAFFTPGAKESLPSGITIEGRALQLLERQGKDAELVQPLEVTVNYPYAEPVMGAVRLVSGGVQPLELKFGSQSIEFSGPAVEAEKTDKLEVYVGEQAVASREVKLKPVRRLQIFLLPHSHNDIGYTALQADVVKKQNSNIETGLRLARETCRLPGRRPL